MIDCILKSTTVRLNYKRIYTYCKSTSYMYIFKRPQLNIKTYKSNSYVCWSDDSDLIMITLILKHCCDIVKIN